MAKKRAARSQSKTTKRTTKRTTKKRTPRTPHKVTRTKAINALTKSRGIVTEAAKMLGCERSYLSNFIRDTEGLAEVRDAAREQLVDTAEKNVWDAVEAGDLKASKWILSRLGKSRGYTLRSEVNANVHHSGRVVVYLPDNGRDNLEATGTL